MKAYWDSGAVIHAAFDLKLRKRLAQERGFSRRHTLVEVFSALSGKPHLKLTADDAAGVLASLAVELDFEELTTEEILDGTKNAKILGVRGGRIHDFLHALAAKKAGATELLTLDRNDFDGLVPDLTITQV